MWSKTPADNAVMAYLGCWGAKTSAIESRAEMVLYASRIYEIDECAGIEELGAKIAGLGKKERRRLAYQNIPVLFPEATDVWPSGIAARFVGGEDLDFALKADDTAIDRMMAKSEPRMISGAGLGLNRELDVDPAQLLRKVVVAVITAGRQDILWEFPEVLAYFGSRIPNRDEVAAHHAVDERMFDAKSKW